MNIKPYIDHFDSIAKLPRNQQFKILEQARDDVFPDDALLSFDALSTLLRVCFVFIFVGGTYLVAGLSYGFLILAVIISLLTARVVINEISEHLILKSLKKILANQS